MASTPARGTPAYWNFLKIAIALLLVGFVLSRTDLNQLLDLLGRISVFWLAVHAFLFLSSTLLKALQYYVLMDAYVAYPQVLNIIVLQNAVSNYLASSAGVISYLTLLRVEHDVKVSRSALVFLLTKIGDLIVIWAGLLFSSFLVWNQIGGFHEVVIFLLAGIGGTLLVFLFTVLFREKFVHWIKLVFDRLGLSRIQKMQNGMNTLRALSRLEQGWLFARLARVLILSLTYFVFSLAWFYTGFLIFGLHLDIPAFIFIFVFLQLISYVPIQIFGGLGVTESSTLYFWGFFNVSSAVLAPILVWVRILFYMLNLLPLIYLPVYSLFFANKAKRPNDQ